jgi:hypothetical protein
MYPVLAIELNDNTHLDKVIDCLVEKHDYHKAWKNNDRELTLPFNCCWRQGVDTMDDAVGHAKQAVASVNLLHGLKLKLTRCVATNSSPWGGITTPLTSV